MADPIEGLEMLGCWDGACPFTRHLGGMRTNGGCRCLYDAIPDVPKRRDIERLMRWIRNRSDNAEADNARLRSDVEALEFTRRDMITLFGPVTVTEARAQMAELVQLKLDRHRLKLVWTSVCDAVRGFKYIDEPTELAVKRMRHQLSELRAELAREQRRAIVFYPIDEWDEDIGDALWWKLPVVERPYCGSPLDDDWPGYHTHWSPLPSSEVIEAAERSALQGEEASR